MPELTVYRNNSVPAPMVCMYCGAPATATQAWREENRKPGAGGGGADVVPVPTGDDPVSAVIGLLMLPLALWELLKALALAIAYFTRPRAVDPPPPPAAPTTTLVVVTTCERHRRFRDRFVWAGLATVALLALLWASAIRVTARSMGTDDVGLATGLLMAAIFSTVLLPLALSTWYAFGGPVIVERVTEGTVVLDRVRPAYFEASGLKPTEGAG